MAKISFVFHSYCEIRYASNDAVACLGRIIRLSKNKIFLHDCTIFTPGEDFAAIITIESRTHGLQVYKAQIKQMTNEYVEYDELELMTDIDRRYGARIAVGLQAMVVDKDNPLLGVDAIIQSLSVSGISIGVHSCYKIGDIIELHFTLNTRRMGVHDIATKCKIVRLIDSTDYGMYRYGCTFDNMSCDDANVVEDYVLETQTEIMRYMYGA